MKAIKKIIYFLISAFRWAMPGSLKAFIKNYSELKFQRGYVKTFSENKPLFEEHFRKYRYYDELKGILNIGRETKVLDVGCGISTVLHFVEGERYGIDPLAEEYEKIYVYPDGIKLVQALSEVIPFEDGYFDVVFCTNVLDHVEDPDKTVAEVLRVLKPGGFFVLTVEVFPKKVTRDPAHPHLFLEEDVRAMVAGRFEKVFDKSSPMMELEEKDGKLRLVESPKGTRELVLLLKKS